MKRRTLDVLFSAGGLALAGLLLVLGVVMTSNANFAKSYVKDQLSAQKITFKPVATLTDEEKKSACLVKYAGKQLTTGKQAECYANEFIGLHVKAAANGLTYAELGVPQTELRDKLAAAQESNDAASVADLQKQLDEVTGQTRDALQGRDTPRPAADILRIQRLWRQGRPGGNGRVPRCRTPCPALDRGIRACVQDREEREVRSPGGVAASSRALGPGGWGVRLDGP